MKSQLKTRKIITLIVFLIIVVVGGVLFIGAVGGWFDEEKVLLDEEYRCKDECDELIELDVETYNELIADQKSFVVLVDQGGCVAADRLREYITDYSKEKKIKVYKMMFSDVKKTSLYDVVRYYPSVALISKGKVVASLKADSDDDAGKYNNYDEFYDWLQKHVK